MRYVMTAVVAALVLPAGAFAQPTYNPNDDPDYARSVEDYQSQSDTYAGQVEDYANRRDAYEDQRQAYARQRQDYERARAEYDAQYGAGAYARYYGPAPVYREYGYAAPTYRRYGYAPAYSSCEPARSNRALTGGLIGALAGAAIGSNIAAHGVRTEGAVLGAVVGGGIGVAVGSSTARCDSGGYYYSYDATYPYREADWDYRGRSGRYDYGYYRDHRCRLAVAPVDWEGRHDYRYVRVCPDSYGHYRITG